MVGLADRRDRLTRLLEAAVAAVDPERLTRAALAGKHLGAVTVIAIGKAAPAMCRGAAQVSGEIHGVCVSHITAEVPDGIVLVTGDHPVPGPASFTAGEMVLDCAATREGELIALISGGGSALCEYPIDGVAPEFISSVTRRLLQEGASIAETNLVRRHLSAVKNGGITREAKRPVDTYAISDVGGGHPSLIASGPTVSRPLDPDTAIAVLVRHGIDVPDGVRAAVEAVPSPVAASPILVIADGRTAADEVARSAAAEGIESRVADWWVQGDVAEALERLFAVATPGVTVVAGEPEVRVTGDGSGGRSTHTALLAARAIAGTDAVFAAFATDGVDGNSSSAGAIVDGATIDRGGDPTPALDSSDSAAYLHATGDLIESRPTGTNVSDLWVLWR